MYKVIKEFAGIKEGEDIDLNKNDAEYMIKEGYVKADKAKKYKPIPLLKSEPVNIKTKIDPEAENLKNK